MSKEIIKIFVEGQGEVILLCQLIDLKFKKSFTISNSKLKATLNDELEDIEIRVFDNELGNGGIDKRKINQLMITIKEFEQLGYKNYLIIDADTPEHSPAGGIERRKTYLESLKTRHETNFEFFIIPDNIEDGNLENLMDKIISSKGQPFYNCLSQYIECLKKLDKNIPIELKDKNLDKIKFEWYVFMMLGRPHRAETNSTQRDYTNDIWDLGSDRIRPLVDFLIQIFGPI